MQPKTHRTIVWPRTHTHTPPYTLTHTYTHTYTHTHTHSFKKKTLYCIVIKIIVTSTTKTKYIHIFFIFENSKIVEMPSGILLFHKNWPYFEGSRSRTKNELNIIVVFQAISNKPFFFIWMRVCLRHARVVTEKKMNLIN